MSVPWADSHFSVSLCTHYPLPPPLLVEGAPSPIFPEGKGGLYTGYLVSVPWADCHFSVSLCTHYPALLVEGAPSPIFPEGRGVCTQAI